MKKTYSIVISSVLFLLLSTTAYALPTLSSTDNQTFNKNQISTQLRDITITEDSATTYITGGVIKITIPDAIAIIFDDERTLTNVVVYGTAVDNGKVLASGAISFGNRDKTLVVAVKENFSPGEYIVITNVYVEGFNTVPAASANMIMQIGGSLTEYKNIKYLHIKISTADDKYKPELPSNIAVQDVAGGVKLTWTDPTDLDVQTIQILKGLNNAAIDAGNPILVVGRVEEYIDTAVAQGDTVKYILRASDGKNTSDNSQEISFTVGSGSTIPPAPPPPAPIAPPESPAVAPPSPPVIPPPPQPQLAPPSPEATPYCSGYTDIPSDNPHCDAITYVTKQGIFGGYPDGTFRPNRKINRAETVKIIVEGFKIALLQEDGTNAGFSDTVVGEWYMPYLITARQNRIIKGYSDGTFKPQQTVNYVEMLKIFFETAKVQLVERPSSPWYQKYLDYALGKGLVPSLNLAAAMKRIDVAELFYKWSLL